MEQRKRSGNERAIGGGGAKEDDGGNAFGRPVQLDVYNQGFGERGCSGPFGEGYEDDPPVGDDVPKGDVVGEPDPHRAIGLSMDFSSTRGGPAERCFREVAEFNPKLSGREYEVDTLRRREEGSEGEADLPPRLPQPPFQLMRTHRFVEAVRPASLLLIIQSILASLGADFFLEKAKAKIIGNMITEQGWFSFVARVFSRSFDASSMAVELQFRQGDRIFFEGFQRAFFSQLGKADLTVREGASTSPFLDAVSESMQYHSSRGGESDLSSTRMPPLPPLRGDPSAFGEAATEVSHEALPEFAMKAESVRPLCEMLVSGYEDVAEEAIVQVARLAMKRANHEALIEAGVIPHLASLITQPSGLVVRTLAALTLVRTMQQSSVVEQVVRDSPEVIPELLRLCSVDVRPNEMAVRRASLQALCELVKHGKGAEAVTDCDGEKVFESIAESCENSALREYAGNAMKLLHHTGTIA